MFYNALSNAPFKVEIEPPQKAFALVMHLLGAQQIAITGPQQLSLAMRNVWPPKRVCRCLSVVPLAGVSPIVPINGSNYNFEGL